MLTNKPSSLSTDVIDRALREFRVQPTPEQLSMIQRYITMLLAWNEKVNLTAIRDPLEILYRHFCESMYAVTAVPLQAGRLADVGSGGGFPGLALKIARPELQVFLIESNVKKRRSCPLGFCLLSRAGGVRQISEVGSFRTYWRDAGHSLGWWQGRGRNQEDRRMVVEGSNSDSPLVATIPLGGGSPSKLRAPLR